MARKSERIQSELSLQAAKDALARARARLKRARADWQRARRLLVQWYRSARARVRRRIREYRIAERERIRRQIVQWGEELKATWVARKAQIERLGLDKVAKAKRLEEHQRERLRELSSHRVRQARAWMEHRAAEKRQESDEEVVRNLEVHHPELVPIFRSMARQIKGSPKMSRTEAMLHWAHDNPDELMGLRAAQQERELAEAIREHEAAERAAQPRRRPSVRKAAPKHRRYAQAVPF